MEGRKVRKRKYRRLRKRGIVTILGFIVLGYLIAANLKDSDTVSRNESDFNKETQNGNKPSEARQQEKPKDKPVVKDKKETTIKISAAGDFTLGRDESFPYRHTFDYEADKNGLAFFVKNVSNIFENDDLTTVNLETTLTKATQKAAKTFRFKGDPAYAKILTLGSIEAVNLANNHTYDYLERGYEDTMDNLEKHNVSYFGYNHHYVTTIKGIKVGALGYEGWEDTKKMRKQIRRGIKDLKQQGAEIILVHFHWGVEKSPVPNKTQQTLARYTIDEGADLILGHHPHVVQGIEEYKGKFIVYSLGNFMFGGNKNPSDKDTFVFQQTFHLKGGELTDKKDIRVLPFSISSVASRNNYQPTPLQGSEAERVTNKIVSLSARITDSNWLVYQSEQ
ncbi:CapA family protein [Priestia megaterium]|nr:CapA family protein [Priestia megaterium]